MNSTKVLSVELPDQNVQKKWDSVIEAFQQAGEQLLGFKKYKNKEWISDPICEIAGKHKITLNESRNLSV